MSTSSSHPSFWRRVPLAFGAFFSTLSDAAYAARVEKLSLPEAAPVAPVALLRHRSPTAHREAETAKAHRG